MRKLSCILLILSGIACSTEQDAEPGMEETFVKLIGNINDDFARDIKSTPDGGYIILSENTVELAEEEISKIHLIKTDDDGNVEWERLFPETGADLTEASERINLAGKSLQVLQDGYIILGDSIYDEESSDLYLMRTDLQGNITNARSIRADEGNFNTQVLESAGSDTFIIMSLLDDNDQAENLSLSEVDGNLNEIWNQQYILGANATVTKSIHIGSNNITWGGTANLGGEQDLRFVTTPFDSKNSFFAPSIGENNGRNDRASDLVKTPTGFIIVGTTNNTALGDDDIYAVSITETGDLLWQATFGGTNDDFGEAVMLTTNDEIVILGTSLSFGNGERELFVVKTDLFGNPLWVDSETSGRTFGGLNDDTGAKIIEAPDGGLVILGTEDFGDVSTLIMIKTDSEGRL
ncbi:MAG: hypothetical protein AAF519_11120 [Bacteroidota bacterium]